MWDSDRVDRSAPHDGVASLPAGPLSPEPCVHGCLGRGGLAEPNLRNDACRTHAQARVHATHTGPHVVLGARVTRAPSRGGEGARRAGARQNLDAAGAGGDGAAWGAAPDGSFSPEAVSLPRPVGLPPSARRAGAWPRSHAHRESSRLDPPPRRSTWGSCGARSRRPCASLFCEIVPPASSLKHAPPWSPRGLRLPAHRNRGQSLSCSRGQLPDPNCCANGVRLLYQSQRIA